MNTKLQLALLKKSITTTSTLEMFLKKVGSPLSNYSVITQKSKTKIFTTIKLQILQSSENHALYSTKIMCRYTVTTPYFIIRYMQSSSQQYIITSLHLKISTVHLETGSQHLTHMHYIMASLSQHAHYCTGNILCSLVYFLCIFHAHLSPTRKISGVSNIKCKKL